MLADTLHIRLVINMFNAFYTHFIYTELSSKCVRQKFYTQYMFNTS